MKKHKTIFEECVEEVLRDSFLLEEGIIPNYVKKTVKLTMDHNAGVDFSENSYIKFKEDGLTVYSIFKRTHLPDSRQFNNEDGNPFVYALKGVNNWRFDITDAEIVKYIRIFLNICKTIDSQYDVIVMAPSKNDLNKRFMSVIYKIVGATVKMEDYS